VSYKQRKELALDLKAIYQSPSEEMAKKCLDDFEAKWDSQYPMISKSWRNNWESVIPFLAYPPNIRKAIYTTNAIESMNMGLRKIIKNRGSFPNDEAAIKLLYLALNNMSKKWTMPNSRLGKSDESIFNYFRRSTEIGFFLKNVIYTELLTPSKKSAEVSRIFKN
ncbi:transposase, mutator-like family protein, partial [Leptospira weilii serovar Topaz str. LT2116]